MQIIVAAADDAEAAAVADLIDAALADATLTDARRRTLRKVQVRIVNATETAPLRAARLTNRRNPSCTGSSTP